MKPPIVATISGRLLTLSHSFTPLARAVGRVGRLATIPSRPRSAAAAKRAGPRSSTWSLRISRGAPSGASASAGRARRSRHGRSSSHSPSA